MSDTSESLDYLPEEDMESLDDLFASAMQAKREREKQRGLEAKKIPSSEKLAEELQRVKRLYADPENWQATRGLTLIDRDTKTLLGHFTEYRHKSDASARKLIRSAEPLLTACATEEISGWLGGDAEARIEAQSWDTQVETTADIWLTDLMVGAPRVELVACLRFGGMVKLQLHSDTQLASAHGDTLLQLPAGTDILPTASLDTKRTVFNQVRTR